MLVFRAELMYAPKRVGGARGGGAVCTARTTPFPKKRSLRALRAHNKRTYTSGTSCAGTRHVPLVGCSSLGSQNTGDGSDGDAEVKKGGLIVFVQGTIKVVLIVAGLIACRTRSFPSALEKSVQPLLVSCSLPGGL